jgi:hypothetical protein
MPADRLRQPKVLNRRRRDAMRSASRIGETVGALALIPAPTGFAQG